jgi:hypothetical protein
VFQKEKLGKKKGKKTYGKGNINIEWRAYQGLRIASHQDYITFSETIVLKIPIAKFHN